MSGGFIQRMREARLLRLIEQHSDAWKDADRWGFGYSSDRWRDYSKSNTNREATMTKLAAAIGPDRTQAVVERFEEHDHARGEAGSFIKALATQEDKEQ